MRTVRPFRLVLTATLTLASVTVVMHPWPNPAPPPQVAPGPIDTLVTTAEPAIPAIPTTSGGRVEVARDLRPAVATDAVDIPVTAMLAYQRAATVVDEVDRTCGLGWTLLAAVGGVESDHGRSAGAVLGDDGVSTPLIRGVALDGRGQVARVADTDAGRVDGDKRWDRAVGPMQFLPATWAAVGVDADGDGQRSADDLDDAALGAAVFLCAAPGSLYSRRGMRTALYRYNPSAAYVARVIALEHAYRTGNYVLPDLPNGGGPVVVRALTPLPTARRTHGEHHQHAADDPHAGQTDGHGHQQGDDHAFEPDPTTGPSIDPTTGPSTDPTTGPSTDPTTGPSTDPTTGPSTGPTPEPAQPTAVTGTLQTCGTEDDPARCVDDTVLDVGDATYLAATALADFDADGTVETNADELAGLAGAEVTVTVSLTDDAPAVLLAIGDEAYVADDTDDPGPGR